jgi:sugar phosphate isomerase/epimerase
VYGVQNMSKFACPAIVGVVVCLAAAALTAGDAPVKPGVTNPFFAFNNGTGRGRIPLEDQAQMLKELGYDGIGYTGTQQIPEMLKLLDARGLKMFSNFVSACVEPGKPPYDSELKTAIEQLKGRDTLIWLTVTGPTTQSDALDDRAVTILRQIADMAAASGLRVALYPHRGMYVAKVEDALRLIGKADRKNLGTSFTLCHFLKLDDEKNLESCLKAAMPHLWLVSINGTDGGETNRMEWDRLIQTLDRGDFDVGRVLRALKRLGYTGPICLQGYAIPGDVRENLAHSMAAWRKLTARIASEP